MGINFGSNGTNLNYKNNSFWFSPSLSVPSYGFAPFDLTGSQLYFTAYSRNHIWQQEDLSTSPAITRVSASGETVGRIDDPIMGHILRAPSAATRPLWSGSYVEFDGSNDRLVVQNSQTGSFSFFHENSVGTILMRIGVRSDNANQTILDSNNGSAGNFGINIVRNASNIITIRVSKGSLIFTHDSSGSLSASMGIVPVEIRFNGASGGDIRINNGALESFPRATTPAAGNTFGNLTIGTRTGGTIPGALNLQDLLISSERLSDADVILWRNYSVSPKSFCRQTGIANASGAPWFNFLHRWHDFTDTTTLWQDTARSLMISASAAIRVADRKNGTHLNRQIQAPSDAARPIYNTDGLGADFDGADDELNLMETDVPGGARTWVYVFRNDDHTNGSRLTDGSNYLSVAGANYVNNPGGIAYSTLHPSSGDTVGSVDLGSETGFNILAFVRNGGIWVSRCRGGSGMIDNGTGSNSVAYMITSFGSAADNDWRMDGRIVEILTYTCALSGSNLDVIFDGLVSKHGNLGV